MRVLFISHSADRSGAPIALLQELRVLKEKYPQIKADILMLKEGILMNEFKSLYPVIKGYIKYSYKNRLLRRLGIKKYQYPYLQVCKKNKYDCIYANTVASFHIAIQIKHKLQIPLIGHVHESESLMHKFNISKKEMEEFDKVITVSDYTKSNLINNYDVPENIISIQYPISIWVDNSINNVINNKHTNVKNNFIINLFCYGGWQKAIDWMPIIINTFCKKYPQANCQFQIIGQISNEKQYCAEYDLKRIGLLDKVKWVGGVNHPLDYHTTGDIFLLLSREDSFPLAAEEAAITETPIIGFNEATGAAEWIKEGAGILVPYMNFEKMAEAIYKLYSDEELRTTMGKKGKEIITVLYNKNYNMETIINIIKGYEKNN